MDKTGARQKNRQQFQKHFSFFFLSFTAFLQELKFCQTSLHNLSSIWEIMRWLFWMIKFVLRSLTKYLKKTRSFSSSAPPELQVKTIWMIKSNFSILLCTYRWPSLFADLSENSLIHISKWSKLQFSSQKWTFCLRIQDSKSKMTGRICREQREKLFYTTKQLNANLVFCRFFYSHLLFWQLTKLCKYSRPSNLRTFYLQFRKF